MAIPCTPQFVLPTSLRMGSLCAAPASPATNQLQKGLPAAELKRSWEELHPTTGNGLYHPLFCSPTRDEIYERHGAAVINRLSFHHLLEDARGRDGSLMAMHLFLRGELGVEPTHAQVQELSSQLWASTDEHRNVSDMAWGLLEPNGVNRPIYQIYTREFVEQLAAYIRKVGQQMPCAPRIVEIAAGDGRLSRALQRRGIAIKATDSQRAGDWPIDYPADVREIDGEKAARGADIILASWLPLVGADEMEGLAPLDVRVAQELLHCPHKTLILIGAHRSSLRVPLTNSDAFRKFIDLKRFQCKFPDELNFTSDYEPLPQSRCSFPGTLAGDCLSDGSKVVVYRARAGQPLPGIRRTSPEIERIREEAQRNPYPIANQPYPKYESKSYLISDRYPILMDE